MAIDTAQHAPPEVARPRRRRDSTHLTITRQRSLAELEKLRPEWDLLYESSNSRNPYAAPDWIETWLRHFADESSLEVLAIWRDDRLVGLAPCFIRRIGPWIRTVQLAGTGTAHDASSTCNRAIHLAITRQPAGLTLGVFKFPGSPLFRVLRIVL